MRYEPSNQIAKRALTVWRLNGIFNSLIFLLASIGSVVLVVLTEVPFWVSVIAIILSVIVSYIMIQVVPKIRYRVWRYEVREYEIELKYGLFIIRRVLIPMIRVQHVDTKQGPLLRHYDLSSVTISTAATVHEIPALDNETADQVRDYISQMARVTEEDV
ncbi:PH domain-containing protein [Pseudalkalibacillus berkeleyi]|uniref:PH domain-containing protein n=1 Tax=Pseudalkalibacillus berkeleyi TaxID=1069813 RepID=A0ABS9H333_9BACL|nr:PH domain-containing protein [Pseudalkalibacillus berkeleyi]MCF6139363.1 PH domain-containing protein [Pseudalkalibacillus berkeleyi]